MRASDSVSDLNLPAYFANVQPCVLPRSPVCIPESEFVLTDCELFSRLYIACQSRDGNLDDFFKHENHPYPPSLSVNGDLRYGTKSDLLDCLCCNAQNTTDLSNIAAEAVIFDGAVVVQMLQPGCS